MIIFFIFALCLAVSSILMWVGRSPSKHSIQKLYNEHVLADLARKRIGGECGYRSAEYNLANAEWYAKEEAYGKVRDKQRERKDFAATWTERSITIGVFFAVIALVIIITRSPMIVAQDRVGLQEKYMSLTIRIKEQAYQDNFDMFDQQIFEEVQTWNTEVQRKHLSLNNPWVNWFVSPAYAEFEAIDYNTIIIGSGA